MARSFVLYCSLAAVLNFLDRLAAFDTEISIQIALERLQKVVRFDKLGLLENLHLTLKTTEILEDN